MTNQTKEKPDYEPGVRKCPKCKCVVIASTLNAHSGTLSANDKPDDCPNGCGPMWRVLKSEWRK